MRIFVFEYVTGGGFLGRALPLELVQEGELIVYALLRDLTELDGVEIVTLRDSRLLPLDLPVTVRTLYHSRELVRHLRRGLHECDAVWPIAPESDGELERLSRAVQEHRCTLIGSRPEAVALAASKLATIRRLAAHGIPVVPSWSSAEVRAGAALPEPPWVVKPDDGVGCVGTHIVRGREELLAVLAEECTSADLVVQPYLVGTHASLSVVAGDASCQLLSCNSQRMVVVNDAFRLAGCVVNGVQSDRAGLEQLARAVAGAIPGLWGYFGIDLILTADGARVLEVNPRLTTSFAGVSRALGVNVAAMVLGLLRADDVRVDVKVTDETVELDLEAMYVA